MLAAHLAAAGLAAAQPAVLPASPLDAMAPAPVGAVVYRLAQDPQPEPEAAARQAPAAEQLGPPDTRADAAAPVAAIDPDDPLLDEYKPASDPLEGFNRISFNLSWTIDKIAIRPAAMVYRAVVPKPARDGLRNALQNLNEPVVFVNDLLQLRPGRAWRTLGRFLINFTIGHGGLFDIARREPFHLAHHDNGLGSTLAYYGVKPGPYIYLPLLGPTNLRDMADNTQGYLWPGVVGKPLTRGDLNMAQTVVDGLDQRERNDGEINTMLSGAVDRYATFRENYLQDRAGEIARLKARPGEVTKNPALDDPLIDPAAPVDQGQPAAEPER